jgi:hypothetical protein
MSHNFEFAPGVLVRNLAAPDWGLGQVQSAIGTRVTVNFEHAGKQLINTGVVSLEVVDPDSLPHPNPTSTGQDPSK